MGGIILVMVREDLQEQFCLGYSLLWWHDIVRSLYSSPVVALHTGHMWLGCHGVVTVFKRVVVLLTPYELRYVRLRGAGGSMWTILFWMALM